MRAKSSLIIGALAGIVQRTISQTLPYNPTTAFLSPKDSDLVYIFLPSGSSQSTGQLTSLNISSTVQASSPDLQPITTALPFLQPVDGGKPNAFLPSIAASGSIGVYAGSCTEESSFWIFSPSSDSSADTIENGTWREMSATASPSISSTPLTNANFLASSFSFSPLVNSNDTQRTVYTFGGMCPTTTTSNSSNWQNSASYSNNMLKLSYSSPTSYQLSLSTSTNNRPIPEAGFTVTALTPTFWNSSIGILGQAQSFVLLGGHTNTAFINMSQVALFSLPEESWSFQGIDSASEAGAGELAIKSASSNEIKIPDPRSGHTAILSHDGTSILMFGGWVGDITTAADPQFAILRIGSGFGGTGDWSWEIPTITGAGLPAGGGLYGHGAVMLPGNVMMIFGGYDIAASSSKKALRRSAVGNSTYFLNITSMSWLSEYTNPTYQSASASSAANSSTDSSGNSWRVGIGAGLGLGLTAILGAVVFYFWYARRLTRRREAREKDLQQLSRSAADFYAINEGRYNIERGDDWRAGYGNEEMLQKEGLGPSSASTTSLGNRSISMGAGSGGGYVPVAYSPHGSYGDYGNSLDRAGSQRAYGIHSGSSIPRKPINARNARGYYQPAPTSGMHQSYSGFDLGSSHSRANSLGTAGAIHPIYEADEDLDNPSQNLVTDTAGGSEVGFSTSGTDHDPFLDPQQSPSKMPATSISGSRPGTDYDPARDRATPTPESSAREREREVESWVADWAAAEAIMNSRAQSTTRSGGRLSPSKESGSGRTESNLSERSVASVSALAISRNNSTRSNSLTAFFSGGPLAWNPFSNLGATSLGLGPITEYRDGDVSPISDPSIGHGHGTRPPASSGSATSSFTTAQTSQSFAGLRAEGESLLARPQEAPSEGSPSKTKAAAFTRRQRAGWLGSLKRAFSGADDDASSNGDSSHRSSPTRGHRSPSFSESPTRTYHEPSEASGGGRAAHAPRRAVSATATMWRRKKGKDDWEDSAEPQSNTLAMDDSSWRPVVAADGSRDGASRPEDDDDEDWDIERAIERRVVQVMFTVPKEKLRVVNHDVQGDEDASETGSLRATIEDVTAPTTASESASAGPSSRAGSPGKGKGKVMEIVEKLEGRSE